MSRKILYRTFTVNNGTLYSLLTGYAARLDFADTDYWFGDIDGAPNEDGNETPLIINRYHIVQLGTTINGQLKVMVEKTGSKRYPDAGNILPFPFASISIDGVDVPIEVAITDVTAGVERTDWMDLRTSGQEYPPFVNGESSTVVIGYYEEVSATVSKRD